MSGLAAMMQRDGAPVDPGALQRILTRLQHRNSDGQDISCSGSVGLGRQHFWTTPEEKGEKQPLNLEGLPFWIVMDGRLDNRPELSSRLGLHPGEAARLSDAALALRAYDRWGERCFEHFLGAFALVMLDLPRCQLVCARDALGDRTLFYTFNDARVVIASEPWAVAAEAGSASEPDECATAHFFALRAPEDGQTLFKHVYELLPAQVMIIQASHQRSFRSWQPDLSHRIHYKRQNEYNEHFRSLLETSIRCRLRSATPIGVLMSGGLDSGSVACLAAEMLAPSPLTTISYVFDELPACDERAYIQMIQERHGTRSIQIPCDDAWPLKSWEKWPLNPNQPHGNTYRLLKERAYGRANQEGLRVLLTGVFGDELYSAGEDWLGDLVLEGRLREAGRELFRHIRYSSLGQTLASSYFRRFGRRLLKALPGGKHLRRKHNAPAWLTPFAVERLSRKSSNRNPDDEHRSSLVGIWAAQDSSSEIFNASRHAVELRHPYRDRRLVEFMLALPAYQLYNHGLYKHILRAAMQDRLPEAIRLRWKPTSLAPLFWRGLERERTTLEKCLQDKDAAWRKYIRSDWLLKYVKNNQPAAEGSGILVPWLCISYESWYKSSVFSN